MRSIYASSGERCGRVSTPPLPLNFLSGILSISRNTKRNFFHPALYGAVPHATIAETFYSRPEERMVRSPYMNESMS
jgi:hypothetical protein